jgi:microcystin-dependent protein
MSEPFLGEIKIVSFNFAPKGWALCNGQLMPINQNQALFALLGTTYGGNGQTNFAWQIVGAASRSIRETVTHPASRSGAPRWTLNMQQLPQHAPLIAPTNTGRRTRRARGSPGHFGRDDAGPPALREAMTSNAVTVPLQRFPDKSPDPESYTFAS